MYPLSSTMSPRSTAKHTFARPLPAFSPSGPEYLLQGRAPSKGDKDWPSCLHALPISNPLLIAKPHKATGQRRPGTRLRIAACVWTRPVLTFRVFFQVTPSPPGLPILLLSSHWTMSPSLPLPSLTLHEVQTLVLGAGPCLPC